jgi:hypothetical protein
LVGVWRGRALAGVHMQSDQSEKTWLWCPVGPHHQELWASIGNSCLACYYGSQANQWRSWKKVTLLCVEAFSVKCCLRKTETGTVTEHGWPELVRIVEFQTHC